MQDWPDLTAALADDRAVLYVSTHRGFGCTMNVECTADEIVRNPTLYDAARKAWREQDYPDYDGDAVCDLCAPHFRLIEVNR